MIWLHTGIVYFSENNVDILRELGGVTFVHNLSKSSVVHADVKEAALFTLGTVAEANGVYQCFWTLVLGFKRWYNLQVISFAVFRAYNVFEVHSEGLFKF